MFRKKTLLALIITAVLLITALAGCTAEERYTVSFESNGGGYVRPIRVYANAEEMQLPSPTMEGYNFDGWFYDSSCTQPVNTKSIPTEDVTFYARWSRRQLSVTFYTDTFSQAIFVDYGSTVSPEAMPDVPQKEGFTGAWDTSLLSPDGQKTNVRIPAIYTPNAFSVKYFVDDEIYFEKTDSVNASIEVPSDPQKDDSVFLGWYSDAAFSTTATPPTTVAAENVTLYARFMSTEGMEDFLTFNVDGDEITVTGLKQSALNQKIVLIPPEIDGKAVTAVGGESAGSFLSERLELLYVPSSVKTVNSDAFNGCSFKTVKLNEGLEFIGSGAFANCKNLTTVTIPATVISIGDDAFMLEPRVEEDEADEEDGSAGLSQIIFSAGSQLQTMGEGAFRFLTLDFFTMPDSEAYEFDTETFADCSIKNIVSFSEKYPVFNDMIYDADYAELVYCPTTYEGEAELHQNTEAIGDKAFYSCELLTKITLPANVKTIGNEAFKSCKNLTSVEFEENSLLTKIGSSAFANGGITAVSLPESLFILGEYAFFGAEALQTVELAGNGPSEIPEGAFGGCVSLVKFGIPTEDGSEKTYILPENVEVIRYKAFFGCENLQAFGFSVSSKLTDIEASAFADCFNLGIVNLPSTLNSIGDYAFSTSNEKATTTAAPNIPAKIKSIGYRAFANSQVAFFNPTNDLTYLGAEAFMGCSSLRSLNLANVRLTELPASCFCDCAKITDVSLSATIEIINEFAFYNCTALKTVKFGVSATGGGTKIIRESAFENCQRLNSAASSAIPAGLTELGKRAYYGCSSLTSFIVPSSLEFVSEEAFAKCTSLGSVSFAADSITTTLDERCFADCTGLRSVALPAALETRDNGGAVKNPFIGCSSLTELTIANHPVLVSENGVIYRREGNENSVYLYPSGGTKNERGGAETAFTVAATVTGIDEYAFYGTAVTDLSFADGSTLTKIGRYAFAYSALNSADISKRVYKIDEYAFYGSKLAVLTVSAERINDDDALDIADFAFGKTNIQTLDLPARTQTVGNGAFSDCFELNSLTFPVNGALTIGKGAFGNDTKLTSLTFTNSVTDIGDYAFYNCYNVETILFDNDTESVSVGAYAFAGNHYLRTVTLPLSLNALGEGVFSDCTELRNVFFPDGGSFAIPDYAFFGSKHLLEINVPDNVTAIGAHAFENSNLERITFANAATDVELEIAEYAFYGAKNLKAVVFPDRLVSIGDYAFANGGLAEFDYSNDENALKIKIGDYAFYGSDVVNVALTERISEIGKFAFADTASLNEVVITSDLPVVISESAFENSSVALLEIPADVSVLREIGERAFANTPNLTLSAVFDVTAVIGDYAFFKSNINAVSFPDGVDLTVGERAFAETSALSEFEINASSLSLGDFAFVNSNISKLVLTGNINDVGVGVAAAASNLGEIVINDETGNYCSVNGILYGVSDDNLALLQYPAAKQGAVLDLSDADLPTVVNYIADYAFYGNKLLTTLVIRGEDEITCEADSFSGTAPALTVYTAENRLDDFADWSIPVAVYREELYELVVKLKISNRYAVVGYTGTENELTIDGRIRDKDGNVIKDKDGNEYRIDGIDKNAFANNARLKSVTIGTGITEIGEYAFYNCVALESFTFGDNVLTVKAHAFENCRNLNSVLFKNGLSVVGDYAFASTGLQRADLPASLTRIGSYAFAYNESLNGVYFAQNSALNEIANDAFSFDKALTSVNMPRSLKKLDNYVFRGCESLTYLYFNSPTAPSLKSVNSLGGTPDGLKIFVDAALLQTYRADSYWRAYGAQMLSQDEICTEEGFENYVLSPLDDGNFRLVCYMGVDVDVVINTDINGRGKITEIGEQAFNQFAETVTLKEGITAVGEYAFTTATALKVLNLPLSVRTIGEHAFENLTSLTTVNINPYSELNSIGEYAFYSCTGLEEFTLPRRLASIGSYAFGGEAEMNLTTVNSEIAADVSLSIGEYAFARNNKLRSLKFDCAIAHLGNGAFTSCTELGALYLNATGDIVPTIDSTATEVFLGCDRLSVFVPNSTGDAILARYRERWRNSFDRALLCAETRIAADELDENGNLVNQEGFVISPINDSGSVAAIINYIGNETEVVFPSSVYVNSNEYQITRLGRDSNQAEHRMNGRIIGNSVTQITIPDSVTEISGDAFRGAAKLEKVVFEELSRLNHVGNYAFADCPELTEITLPKSLVSLNSYAFYNCVSLTALEFEAFDDTESDTSLTIGEHAFENCKSLSFVQFPAYLAHLEQYAFYGASALAGVDIPSESKLTEIARYAFAETALAGISLPASVASVGSSAFFNCANLKYVRLSRVTGSGYTSVTAADTNVFNGVTDPFVKVYVPDIAYASYTGANGWSVKTVVPDLSFATEFGSFTYRLNSAGGTTATLTGYVGSATDLTVPVTFTVGDRHYYVTTIAAYFGNKELKSVQFEPNYVTTIDTYAFAECSALEKIVIADSVNSIERYAFNNCTSLQDVTLPSSLGIVSPFTFAGCSALTKIRIPAGVSKIDDSAFINCVSLSRVEIDFTAVSSIGRNAFTNTGANLVIVVPETRKASFQNEWRDYASLIYDRSERYGDFVLAENETGYTLIQYLGHADVLDLNELTFNGKNVTAVSDGAVIDEDVKILFGETDSED